MGREPKIERKIICSIKWYIYDYSVITLKAYLDIAYLIQDG